VYNLLGQTVQTLRNEVEEAGQRSADWNAADLSWWSPPVLAVLTIRWRDSFRLEAESPQAGTILQLGIFDYIPLQVILC
jgi:hypothetical protein